ncbi:lysophospholipase L1-like esterase [Actinomadura luteofluorescens]|uniref:Lysophospholipase L1-like esterase n=1 Tax=Actinomadura luteofluorescens TaxID=46163 RepID=A0A7Y9JFA6_9ACTN|nr:SGNH/GDSL hydrolase family protein [Actinomadura luteofluorescens]NYD46780.1 lysophospholipase L1-like esterase [Actinomadura luteofluorescens]
MWRAFTARRIAAAAAYGGGGITALGGITFGLLLMQARLARRTILARPNGDPPIADGLYGGTRDGEPLSLVMLGDSTAAGLGVHTPDETPAALLATGLSAIAGRPVRLTNVARSGSRSQALGGQVDRALQTRPDVAVIMIGANDVTGRVPAAESVRHLARAVERLRGAGGEVVVGTCPDLGSVKSLMPPLRWFARRASRQLAAAQTIAVVERGGRSVSLGDLLGHEFAADPLAMFSEDRYHPSARGYAAAAAAVLPSMASALDLGHDLSAHLTADVLPVYLAAAEAAERAGTEVSGASVAGHDRGPRGRWATLRRPPLRRPPLRLPWRHSEPGPARSPVAGPGRPGLRPALRPHWRWPDRWRRSHPRVPDVPGTWGGGHQATGTPPR